MLSQLSEARCHVRAGAGAEAEAPVGLQQRDAGAAPGLCVRVRRDPEHAAVSPGEGRAHGRRQVHAARAHRRLRPGPLRLCRRCHEGAFEMPPSPVPLHELLLLLHELHLVSKGDFVLCLSVIYLPKLGYAARAPGLSTFLDGPLPI